MATSPPPVHPPRIGDAASSPLPVDRILTSSAGRLGPCVTQTCYTGGTWGTVGSLPPVSLFFPERDSVKSEPGGWSDSRLLPGTPPLGTGVATDVSVNRPGKTKYSYKSNEKLMFPEAPLINLCMIDSYYVAFVWPQGYKQSKEIKGI